mgnify:CR=1 FL=1
MDLILNLLNSNDKSDEVLINGIDNYFQLPIEMLEKKIEISKNLQNDLELIEFKNNIEDMSNNLTDISNNITDISNNLYKYNIKLEYFYDFYFYVLIIFLCFIIYRCKNSKKEYVQVVD